MAENIFFTIAAFFICACILISSVCHIKIYRILRQHQLQIYAQQQVAQSINAGNNETIQRSVKGAINAFIYYIVNDSVLHAVVCYDANFSSCI